MQAHSSSFTLGISIRIIEPLYGIPQANPHDTKYAIPQLQGFPLQWRRNLGNGFRVFDSGRSKFAGIQAFHGPAPPGAIVDCSRHALLIGTLEWLLDYILYINEHWPWNPPWPLARCANGVKPKILFSGATRSPEQQAPFHAHTVLMYKPAGLCTFILHRVDPLFDKPTCT